VSELSAEGCEDARARFTDVWIEEEISNFKEFGGRPSYFTLKDDRRAAARGCFSNAARVPPFQTGKKPGRVFVHRGRITAYEGTRWNTN